MSRGLSRDCTRLDVMRLTSASMCAARPSCLRVIAPVYPKPKLQKPQTLAPVSFRQPLSAHNCIACFKQPRAYSSTAIRNREVASQYDAQLPLQGYKVLDLTRVLAGVHNTSINVSYMQIADPFHCRIALLYADTRRSRVSSTLCDFVPHDGGNVDGRDRADVIKVEHPLRGDDTRAWGPPFAKYTDESASRGPGESAYFLSVCLL